MVAARSEHPVGAAGNSLQALSHQLAGPTGPASSPRTTSVGLAIYGDPPRVPAGPMAEKSVRRLARSEVLRLHEWMIGGCALGFMQFLFGRGLSALLVCTGPIWGRYTCCAVSGAREPRAEPYVVAKNTGTDSPKPTSKPTDCQLVALYTAAGIPGACLRVTMRARWPGRPPCEASAPVSRTRTVKHGHRATGDLGWSTAWWQRG